MIRIGLLGCGRIGAVHARSLGRLQDRAQLVAVTDIDPVAARILAGESGVEVMDPDTMIGSDTIDAVIIGTPTTTHSEYIHAACRAGKAIFCEKPIDLTTERVHDCIGAINAANVPFFTAFQRRFDPGFAALEAQLRAGELGQIELVILTSRDPAPPPNDYIRASGGLFRDMMIHDLDMARFLLAEEPTEIFATGACLVDPAIGAAGDVDTAAVILKTSSGAICQISNSRRATYGYDQRIEVHGEHGMLQAANHPEHMLVRADADGFRTAPNRHFFLERYAEAYFGEMRAFLDALTSGTAIRPNHHDGLRAQILADCAQESLETGQAVSIDPG
ncbi:MAG: inositol 2-dehydrogenase [Rhodobacteraceae bacterium]|nr:inositol 2-dehydrogenase [Paracoccaceae bacterium]